MNQCQVINATGPNRGNRCKSKIGIKDRVCYNHRCRCIDTTVNREQDYQDEDYDYDDGFMVRNDEEAEFEDDDEEDEEDEEDEFKDEEAEFEDEEAEFEDEEAEFEDEEAVCPEINWDTVDYDSIMLEHESKQVPDKKNTKTEERTKNVVYDSLLLQRPTFDAIITPNPLFAKVNAKEKAEREAKIAKAQEQLKTRHKTLENIFPIMSLFDLRFFTGIQNINMQPIDERAFIISSYFTYTNCNV